MRKDSLENVILRRQIEGKRNKKAINNLMDAKTRITNRKNKVLLKATKNLEAVNNRNYLHHGRTRHIERERFKRVRSVAYKFQALCTVIKANEL